MNIDYEPLNNRDSVEKKLTSRRKFIAKSVTTIAGISTLGFVSRSVYSNSATELRVIAYNVYGCKGWPKDNPHAKMAYNKGQIPKRIAQELALFSPDVINFSESPDESIVKEIAGLLGMNYAFFPSGGNWPGALLTRFDIIGYSNAPVVGGIRREELFTRHWGRALVRLSDGQSVAVHSVHLFPHDNKNAGEIRKKEIKEILKVIVKDTLAGIAVVVMGDLNHTPHMPEYEQWINAGCIDTFTQAGQGKGLTIKADEPITRIDYVLVKGSRVKSVIESRSLFEGAFRTNPSDSSSFALSDHLPQLAVIELAN